MSRNYHIIHFIKNEKFIDGIIEMWDSFLECDNHYCIFKSSIFTKVSLNLIKRKNQIEILSSDTLFQYLDTNNNLCDVIVLHNFSVLPTCFISKINPKIKVIWLSWGDDIYNKTILGYQLVKTAPMWWNETQKVVELLNKEKSIAQSIAFIKRLIKYICFPNRIPTKKRFLLAINRVDWYSGVLPYEFDQMCDNSFFRAQKIDYSYNSSNCIFKIEDISRFEPTNTNYIQVGNSCDPSNNHIDLFLLLKNLNVNQKVIVPLSYGDMRYRKMVLEKGNEILGNYFVPLTEFLEYSKYSIIMKSCYIAIFAHERQQAIGNVYLALWNGCKVFMSENNFAFDYLKRLGFIIYSIQQDLTQSEMEKKLDFQSVLENRKILANKMSYESSLLKISEILKSLE